MFFIKISLFILSLAVVGSPLLLLMPWSKTVKRNKKVLSSWLSGSLAILVGGFFMKDYPVLDKGQCFVIEKQVINEHVESWDAPEVIKDVEYQVLKIGNKNYLVHSSIPSLQNFNISKDLWVKKSDCSIIFKKN